jgi:hypothetical protein
MRHDVEFFTVADHAGKQKIGRIDAGKDSRSFEKKMEGLCPKPMTSPSSTFSRTATY